MTGNQGFHPARSAGAAFHADDFDWLGFRAVETDAARKRTPLFQQRNDGGETIGRIDELCAPILLDCDAGAHWAAAVAYRVPAPRKRVGVYRRAC